MSQLRSISEIKTGLGLRELRAVLAVAELGSFRRAAAELGYTQSALSHQVSALEEAIGWPLFHRPGGRAPVRLTAAGEAVCRRARRVLSEVEAMAADAEGAERGEKVRVRVGVSQTAAAEIMPPALRAFREEHPGVEVVLSETDDATAPSRSWNSPGSRCSTGRTWSPGPTGGWRSSSSKRLWSGGTSRRRSSIGPMTTWRSSDWWPPGSATRASGVWLPGGRSIRHSPGCRPATHCPCGRSFCATPGAGGCPQPPWRLSPPSARRPHD